MIKLSVIVPVYNVEKYLKKCIESILNQTFIEYELILVNDGSTDKSGKICEEYAKKDDRIKIVHKKNGGLSSARNEGLKIAQGQYIAFVDSDDAIHMNMYSILYEEIIKRSADIAICKFVRLKEGERWDEKDSIYEVEEFNNIAAIEQLHKKNATQYTVACNKIYNINLFKGLKYMEGKIHEDEFIIHHILYRANKVIYIEKELYYYTQREGSIMNSTFNLNAIDIIDAFRERTLFLRVIGLKELAFKSEYMYIYNLFKYYLMIEKNYKQEKLLLKRLKKEFKDNLYNAFKNPQYTFKEKIIWIVFSISPKIYKLYQEWKY